MSEPVFVRLEPAHLMEIERQPSQELLLGVNADQTEGEAQQLAAMPVAWSMFVEGRLVACFGIADMFAGHGLGWAVLAKGLGRAHLALTRFARACLAGSGHRRVDTFARAADIEHLIARNPGLDTGHIVAMAMTRQTPEIRWAVMLGFRPAHVLRRYGAADETCMLLERVEARA